MQYIHKLRTMNFGYWYEPQEEDYLIPSKEEIMMQWFHELENMDQEEAIEEIENL